MRLLYHWLKFKATTKFQRMQSSHNFATWIAFLAVVQSYHKISKNAIKSVFLAIRNIEKKWTVPFRDWGVILNQFMIIFEQN
jgi:transposase-like protein